MGLTFPTTALNQSLTVEALILTHQLLISLYHPIERQMVDIFADDDVCQQRGVCHTLVKRRGRQGCYPEGFPIRIRHLKIALKNELVANNLADKHLTGGGGPALGRR